MATGKEKKGFKFLNDGPVKKRASCGAKYSGINSHNRRRDNWSGVVHDPCGSLGNVRQDDVLTCSV